MKYQKKKLIGMIGLIFIFFAVGLMCWNPFLKISLIGKKEVTIEVGSDYKDEGARATFFMRDVTGLIEKNQISTNRVGTYEIQYQIRRLWTTKKVTRMVKIVDKKAPAITLKGKEKITLTLGSTYEEPGYEAMDEYDGDLSKKVKVEGSVNTNKVGEYILTYKVSDQSKNQTQVKRIVVVKSKGNTTNEGTGGYREIVMGPKYIKGILIVNKKYALPKTYGSGVDQTASSALGKLQSGAQAAGFSIPLLSGYRSYQTQVNLYQRYVNRDGQSLADTYSARAGHSEHQTGLAFDVGSIDNNYGNTPAGKWLVQNCAAYGFILRYPKGKEAITGYQYEPWHIRYVGVEIAKEIMTKKITLEEYLGVA